jgi:hypothetical protein
VGETRDIRGLAFVHCAPARSCMTANHDLSDAESPWPRRGRPIGTVVGRLYERRLRIGTGKDERGRQAAAGGGDKTARWGSGEAEGSRRAEARASSSSLPRPAHGPVDSNDAGGSPPRHIYLRHSSCRLLADGRSVGRHGGDQCGASSRL